MAGVEMIMINSLTGNKEAASSYHDITETPDRSFFVSLFRAQIVNLSVRSSKIRFSMKDCNQLPGTTNQTGPVHQSIIIPT